jgi:hypothetical protein
LNDYNQKIFYPRIIYSIHLIYYYFHNKIFFLCGDIFPFIFLLWIDIYIFIKILNILHFLNGHYYIQIQLHFSKEDNIHYYNNLYIIRNNTFYTDFNIIFSTFDYKNFFYLKYSFQNKLKLIYYINNFFQFKNLLIFNLPQNT